MKKISLILALVLLMTTFAFVGGCSEEQALENPVEIMYDFEDVDRNLYQLKPFMDFGVISINKDSKYVSQGQTSYKLQPIGVIGTSAKPLLVFPTYSNDYDYNFMDFTKFKTVIIDFYNAEDNEVTVDIGVTLDAGSKDRYESWLKGSTVESFALNPGWNTVNYVIPHDMISFRGDVQEIYGVFIAFENSRSMLVENSQTIYVDNIRIERLKEEHQVNKQLDLEVDDENGVYEILSFDKDYQKYLVWVSRDRTRKMHPDMEIYNPLMGEEIGNVLKLTTRQMPEGTGLYPTTIIAKEAIAKAYENAIKNGDGYDYYFCMDIYNASDALFWFRLEFLSSNTQKTESSALWNTLSLEPKSWSTWEYNLKDVDINTGKDADGGSITKSYLSDMGNAQFIWEHYDDEVRREFWLDNIRIERREKASS